MHILVSGFPRSGNTYLLYCVGILTGCRVITREAAFRITDSNHHVADVFKSHSLDDVLKAVPNEITLVIFALRNYKEAVIRHAQHFKESGKEVGETELLAFCCDYMRILEDFDSLTVKKLLVRYEDMIQDPCAVIHSIGHHLKTIWNGNCGHYVFSQLFGRAPKVVPQELRRIEVWQRCFVL